MPAELSSDFFGHGAAARARLAAALDAAGVPLEDGPTEEASQLASAGEVDAAEPLLLGTGLALELRSPTQAQAAPAYMHGGGSAPGEI